MKYLLLPLLALELGVLLYLLQLLLDRRSPHVEYMQAEYPDRMAFWLVEMKIDQALLDIENR